MEVVCYGDSNTYGFDPRSYFGERYSFHERWTGILAEKMGWEVINEGMNGREVPRAPVLFPSDMDFLIIMLGTNDLLQGKQPAEIAMLMKRFLNSLSVKKILLIAPPYLKLGEWVPNQKLIQLSKELSSRYRDVADQCGVLFADAEEWNVDILFDGVHFSEKGHCAFAEGLFQYLMNLKMG